MTTPSQTDIPISSSPALANPTVDLSNIEQPPMALDPDQLNSILSAISHKSNVVISKLPQLDISLATSTDFTGIAFAAASCIITLLIVLSTTKTTTDNHKRMIESQEKIALDRNKLEQHKSNIEMISRNRQIWINELRAEISQLISTLEQFKNVSATIIEEIKMIYEATPATFSVDQFAQLQKDMINLAAKSGEKKSHILSKITTHQSKIRLLLNPEENSSKKLISQIHDFVNYLEDDIAENKTYEFSKFFSETPEQMPEYDIKQARIHGTKHVQCILSTTQSILKAEWIRVKNTN